MARIKYDGNFDPEPLAWSRLAALMARREGIALEVSGPMEIEKLDVRHWPIAAMTGTRSFHLSGSQATALRKYIAAGGRLVVDAAGGSKEFRDSARGEIAGLYGQAKLAELASDHAIYHRPEKIDKIIYRGEPSPDRAGAGGRLEVIVDGQKVLAVFSPDDLTTGLLGVGVYKLRGYSPQTAQSLMMNILNCLAGR